jgi:hypothetical protein
MTAANDKGLLEFTAIDLDKEKAWRRAKEAARATALASFRAVEFAEDDLEQPVAQSAEQEVIVPEPEGLYFPVTVNPLMLREYYPRRNDLVGTRLVYKSGAARPVKELYAEVKAKIDALGPLFPVSEETMENLEDAPESDSDD